MKHAAILSLTVWLLPVHATAELPNNPRPEFVYVEPEYAVACTPARFLWQSNYAYDRKSMEIRPNKRLTFKQQSTETCTLAGHKVRLVLTSLEPPHEHCRATTSAHIDLWVDGRQVMPQASWGDWMSCMQGEEVHAEEVTRIVLDTTMHLTVCHDTPQHTSQCETASVE